MAAKAPRPGANRREAALAVSQSIMTITIGDHPPVSLAPKNMPFSVDAAIRRATGGLPFDAYWQENIQLNEASLLLAWYAARLSSGERVTFQKCTEEFPNPLLAEDYDVTWTVPDMGTLEDEDASPES